MKTGDNVRLRADGRYEARYKKGRLPNGKIQYGYCYGKTIEEAEEKRDYELNRLAKKNRRELNLLILGAGDHGLETLEIARSLRIFSKISFLDDNVVRENVIGKWQDVLNFKEEYPVAIVAVGDEEVRYKWMTRIQNLGFIVPTLIHPTAFISEGATVGVGSVICARTTIAAGVKIGVGCIVSSGSTISKKQIVPDWGYYLFDKCILNYQREYRVQNID